jgi:hypothetical protein
MKRIIYTIFIALFSHAAFAQMQAKLTDRFLVKTDLIGWTINNAYNASIEARITQHLTLSAAYYSGSREYKQQYSNSQYIGRTSIVFSSPPSIPEKGIVNSSYAVLGLRKYFGNVVKAPFGVYGALNYGFGKLDIAGSYGAYLVNNSYNTLEIGDNGIGPMIKYTYKNVPMQKFMAGMGMQRLIFGHFYYDAALYVDYTMVSTGNDTDDKIISGITRYFGSNLLCYHIGSANTMGLTGQLNISYLIY